MVDGAVVWMTHRSLFSWRPSPSHTQVPMPGKLVWFVDWQCCWPETTQKSSPQSAGSGGGGEGAGGGGEGEGGGGEGEDGGGEGGGEGDGGEGGGEGGGGEGGLDGGRAGGEGGEGGGGEGEGDSEYVCLLPAVS